MKTSQLISASLMSAIGSSFFLMLPVILAAAASALSIDEVATGYLASAYFSGFLLVGLTIPTLEKYFNPRQISWFGFIPLVISLAVASQSSHYATVLLLLFVTGVGAGILFANAFSVISIAENVERWFGLKLTSEQLIGACLLLTLPLFATGFSQTMMVLALIFTLMIFITHWLPDHNVTTVTVRRGITSMPRNVQLGLIAIVVKFIGMSGLWAFLEQFSGPLNIDNRELSIALGISLIGGLLGGLIASVQGHRWSRQMPLIASTPLLVIVVLCYSLPLSFTFFTINTFCLSLLWNYTLTYELAVVAGADIDNEFSALMSPALALGAIVGPMLAGHIIMNWQFQSLLLLAIVAIVMSLMLFLLVDRRASKLVPLGC